MNGGSHTSAILFLAARKLLLIFAQPMSHRRNRYFSGRQRVASGGTGSFEAQRSIGCLLECTNCWISCLHLQAISPPRETHLNSSPEFSSYAKTLSCFQFVFRLLAMASNSALRGSQYFCAVHRFPQYTTPRITQPIPAPWPSFQNSVGSCKPTSMTI